MNCDRRRFLGLAGAGAAALALPPGLLGCASRGMTAAGGIERVGLQLYTLRNVLRTDFEATLRRVAAIGYRELEFAGYHGRTPGQVRALIDDLGLTAPASHVPIEALRTDWAATLDAAEAVGHRYLVVAWLAEADRRDLAALRGVAELFNRAGAEARRRGLRFAYHNHDFEFQPVEGRLPFDVLLEATDPAAVEFEMDLFWITKGNADPLAYFARHPGRFPLVHVKDMAADGSMVDVGAGRIDWRRIFAAREQAGIRHWFVEHDNPPDPMASVATSYAYLAAIR